MYTSPDSCHAVIRGVQPSRFPTNSPRAEACGPNLAAHDEPAAHGLAVSLAIHALALLACSANGVSRLPHVVQQLLFRRGFGRNHERAGFDVRIRTPASLTPDRRESFFSKIEYATESFFGNRASFEDIPVVFHGANAGQAWACLARSFM